MSRGKSVPSIGNSPYRTEAGTSLEERREDQTEGVRWSPLSELGRGQGMQTAQLLRAVESH